MSSHPKTSAARRSSNINGDSAARARRGTGSRGSNRPKKSRGRSALMSGLMSPAGRIARQMQEKWPGSKICKGASVFMVAVLKFLAAEVLEVAGDSACRNNQKRITSHHVQLAANSKKDLRKLFADVWICSGDVVRNDESDFAPSSSDLEEESTGSAPSSSDSEAESIGSVETI